MPSRRAYESSHPWLTFSADLRGVSYRTWLLLGEAASKSAHVSWSLLRPDVAERLLRVYLVRGALATTAIEGNTLSEDEAGRIADGSLRLPPSKEYLAQEIRNVLAAFNEIRDEVFDHDDGAPHADVPITVEQVKRWNRLVLADLEVGEDVVPGEIRTHSVVVGAYRGAPAEDCEHLLERLCAWLNSGSFPDERRLRAPLAIVKAILAHLYLAWIHPFGDGNGRTARLLELQILLSAGFAMPTTQLLSNHYNATRSEYYRQLDVASRTGSPLGFLHYAVEGFVDELHAQIDRIWSMQYADRWEQFVYETFGEVRGESERRRLRLVKDLSRASILPADGIGLPKLRPVPRHELRHLSPQLAELYAGRTERTLTRDLDELLRRELIRRTRDGYVPASRRVLAFMPRARDLRLV